MKMIKTKTIQTILDIIKKPRKKWDVFKKTVLIFALTPAFCIVSREESLVNQIIISAIGAFMWINMYKNL